MKNIIQSLWIGGRLSTVERLSIASYLAHGHEVHLYTYGEVAGVPRGTVVRDAGTIIPERDVFTYCGGSYAGFADWFRWELVYRQGGYWTDTDVVCLRPFNFDDDIVFGNETLDLSCPGLMRFPAGHQFARWMADVAKHPNRWLPYDSSKSKLRKFRRYLLGNRRSKVRWGEAAGPVGFTAALKHFGLFEIGKPFTFFYPVHCFNWKCIFTDALSRDAELFADTYAIHLWNEMTRREPDFDKDGSFAQNSLFEQLKRKYLPGDAELLPRSAIKKPGGAEPNPANCI